MDRTLKLKIGILLLLTVILFAYCKSFNFAEEGLAIISAEKAMQLLGDGQVVVVDAQTQNAYKKGHLVNAVNISRADIVVNTPVMNMLAPQEQIERVLGINGIISSTKVLIYDANNNMDSSRLWWTMKVYGHEDVMVISGGLQALQEAGAQITQEVPRVAVTIYKAKPADTSMIATTEEVLAQVNMPKKEVVLLDTRTQAEFDAGTIPGSVFLDYAKNNYPDGTFRKIQDIKIMYIEAGIEPSQTVIMYCKTSIRGAQTYVALYNAGYRNLKLYDGAYDDWVRNPSNPIQMPEVQAFPMGSQDQS